MTDSQKFTLGLLGVLTIVPPALTAAASLISYKKGVKAGRAQFANEIKNIVETSVALMTKDKTETPTD